MTDQVFYWLLELCNTDGTVTPKPKYVNKGCNDVVQDAWLAHWFTEEEKAVALEIATRLNQTRLAPSGFEFRFTEHGFISK